MDSRTRVEAALALEVADRPPVAWWGHTFIEEWSPKLLADVTIERARRFGWDFVKFQPRASSFAEAFGASYAPSGNATEAPIPGDPLISELGDWEELRLLKPAVLEDQQEAIGAVARALGPSVPVLQTVFSPLTVAGYLVAGGKEQALSALRTAPEVLRPALRKIGGALAQFAASSIEAGAAGIFYAISGYAASDMTTPEEYESLVAENDRSLLASLPSAGWFNVLHLCGAKVHFGLAADLPAQAVSWSVHDPGNPSLSEGRDRSGKAIMGGLDRHATLVNGPPEAVIEEGSDAVSETGGRGLLLAPGCSVPVDASQEHLQAIREVFLST